MNDFDDEFDQPSKSERKREAHALQKLGEELIGLSADDFAQMPIPDNLRDAIVLARKIKSHSALKRQTQYIGKLMRSIDAEPVEEALNRLRQAHQLDVRRLHELERWRDRLITEGDAALGDLLAEFPDIERSQLRQLVRNAQSERESGKPAGAGRALFRYLQSQ